MRLSFGRYAAGLLLITNSTLVIAQQNCIILKGDSSYKWLAGGTWSGSGTVDGKQHCFATGSGRISVGKSNNLSQKGNSLIECFFGAGNNCDISLVDGWSAAVTCEINGGGWPGAPNPNAGIGTTYNLQSICPSNLWNTAGQFCSNQGGDSAASLAGVPAPFQTAHNEPNHPIMFPDDSGDYTFNAATAFPITCTISAGVTPGDGTSATNPVSTNSVKLTTGTTGTTNGIVSNQVVNNVVQQPLPSTTSSVAVSQATPATNPPNPNQPNPHQWTGHWGGHKRDVKAVGHGHLAAGVAAAHVRAVKGRSLGAMVMRK